MKILVINGSPKKDKSDTMHITRAFLDGMNGMSQNEVNIIHAIDKHEIFSLIIPKLDEILGCKSRISTAERYACEIP